jgi:hypothetical protein
MKEMSKSWLQLFVDARTEKDPYKRLALVEELRKMQKPGRDEMGDEASSQYRTRPQRTALDRNRFHHPAAQPKRSSHRTRARQAKPVRACRPKPQPCGGEA